jgi:excisionase family DNA binding protein
MDSERSESRPLMRPGEVAALFRVHPQTIGRWVRKGALEAFRTPGGQMRFDRAYIERKLKEDGNG